MSLIDSTYFVFDLNLPVGTFSDLPGYITRFEPQILERVFGYELAKEIQEYDSETAVEPLKSLIEGAEFTVDERLYKWKGLVNAEKLSLIAYYVYYWQRRCTVTVTTAQGEKSRNTENMGSAEYGIKIMAAWDAMIEEIKNCYAFIKANEADYPTFQGSYFGSVNAFDL